METRPALNSSDQRERFLTCLREVRPWCKRSNQRLIRLDLRQNIKWKEKGQKVNIPTGESLGSSIDEDIGYSQLLLKAKYENEVFFKSLDPKMKHFTLSLNGNSKSRHKWRSCNMSRCIDFMTQYPSVSRGPRPQFESSDSASSINKCGRRSGHPPINPYYGVYREGSPSRLLPYQHLGSNSSTTPADCQFEQVIPRSSFLLTWLRLRLITFCNKIHFL